MSLRKFPSFSTEQVIFKTSFVSEKFIDVFAFFAISFIID
jgi:hypothetical protein